MVKPSHLIGPVELKSVNFGVDTFIVNFKFAGEDSKPNGDTLPEHYGELLDSWQVEARKDHKPAPTALEYRGKTLFIRPHGSGVWSWLLFNEDVTLSLSYGSMNGGVFCQVKFLSHLLWSIGPDVALLNAEKMLFDWIQHKLHAQASEIHICNDLQGWYDGPSNWQEGFVTRVVNIRARPDEPTEQEQEGGLSPRNIRKLEQHIVTAQPIITTTHRRIATLDFGSHGSEIMGQIYNKSQEIKKSKKTWFEPIWRANGWDGSSTIWRDEFRFRRKSLASFDLNDAYEVLAQVPELWAYATQKWLRYVDLDAVDDTNKSRLPADPVWKVVQMASASTLDVQAVDLVRDEEARFSVVLDHYPEKVLQDAALYSLQTTIDDEMILTEEELAGLGYGQEYRSFERMKMGFQFLWFLMDKRTQTRILAEWNAVEQVAYDVPKEVLAEMVQEHVEKLTPEQRKQVIARHSPESFQEVRAMLIKREKQAAKKKNCVSSFAGYLTSIMALSVHEVADLPDMAASLLVAFEEVKKYNKEKGRVHLEEVLKKRLAYGFITAQQLDEEKRMHGIELSNEDWEALEKTVDALMGKQTGDRRRSKRNDAA